MISRIKNDSSLQNQFKEQQQRKEKLEQSLAPLQRKLELALLFKAEDLRKERNAAIREIYTIEEERMKIIDGIIKKSLDAKRIITI